ncbi:sel1 repeat family protein [Hydrogenophaga sp.]|uniref:tetratricopeptide repeat protein n=1 Tax=Hydrogenophaga sp. TaxID=1904254 RepID=UPI0026363888|nr:sel1 repeat family protein [Hydrogenophaga sp.]MDM7951123.1 sel1 repeat family protein [Hydrogenophaga sp.]
MKHLIICLLLATGAAQAQTAEKTIRICDASGCSDRPRSSSTFDPAASSDPEGDKRIAALTAVAEKDPRAAHDLGLRYFRGDGVPQNTFQALQWMRSAGERGDLRAQNALGRFYLSGLQEMGADPAEAERWLTMAAGRGDKEAAKLLPEATAAKNDEQAAYRWREAHRKTWYGYWYAGYPYYWVWGPTGWYYR